eukprot:g1517.t1
MVLAESYCTLKEKVCQFSRFQKPAGADPDAGARPAAQINELKSNAPTERVATIENGVEALKLAEHLERRKLLLSLPYQQQKQWA